LRARFLDSLLDLARLYMEEKLYPQAIAAVERAINEEHCYEEAYQLGMQIHDATDNPAGVQRLYDQCCKAMLAEWGAEPGKNTRQLYETLKH
jgi:DNA-binding SARP family transcriptional activator